MTNFNPNRTYNYSVSMVPGLYERFQRMADALHISVSELIRTTTTPAVEKWEAENGINIQPQPVNQQ